MRISYPLIGCILLAYPSFTWATDPAPPTPADAAIISQTHDLLDALKGDASGARAMARKRITDVLGKELNSRNPATEQQAIEDVKTFEGLPDADWDRVGRAHFHCFTTELWSGNLIRLKQYDLVDQMALKGFSAGTDDTSCIDKAQRCHVLALLGSGKAEEGLSAAKAYYNACKLEHTAQASDLVIQALLKSRARTDKTIVHRFKLQQAAGSQASSAIGPTSQPDLGENVLKSIKIDGTPYEAAIKELAESPKQDYTNLTAEGNLLLLADRSTEAKAQFDLAVDMAADDKQLAAAVENVARAIRAIDGSVGGANAYILSLRQGQK